MTAWTADWYQGQTPEQRNATTAQQISEYRRRLAAA
jgi:CDP-glucose 4,6-dehydratase